MRVPGGGGGCLDVWLGWGGRIGGRGNVVPWHMVAVTLARG